MLINLREHIHNGLDDLVSHIVFHCASQALLQQITNDPVYDETGNLDIKLMVNGHELDFEKFCDHWQSQINEAVVNAAKELIDEGLHEKLRQVEEMIEEVKSVLQSALTAQLKQQS
jgi:hypothetical protein